MIQESIIGADVGGTFTDFVFVGTDGRLRVRKRASTPLDPSESIIAGIQDALAAGLTTGGYTLIHGTTVATNALLERRGARAALLTTAGFRDVLEIGRQARSALYALHPAKPVPLLPREQRHELTERVDWQGNVFTPLDAAQAGALLDRLKLQGVESLAVCFLFSYLNPAHERQVGAMAHERGFAVSLSCEIAPEPREYERTSTTVANAFVAPVMARYLSRLEAQLRQAGAGLMRVMQSNGGALSPGEAAHHAIKTVLSGPAGGVVAAAHVGSAAGFPRLLTFDMGGTSTDVALLLDGRCPVVTSGRVAGLPLQAPMLDIHTVGAGGGSLARLNAAGGLRVGPQSAGADPGPVAYGKGETVTVTDANLLLGRLPVGVRLAGYLPLDAPRVRAYFAPLAAAMRCTPEEAALGVVRIADTTMARALRHISVERGYDPADFTLLSFGGAGGLHACSLAEMLGMRTVLVPRYPGAFSAMGLALAEVMREYVQPLPAGASDRQTAEIGRTLEAMYVVLERQAAGDMEAEGFASGSWNAQRLLDLRYAGQSFDLRLPVVENDLAATVTAFHNAHRTRYGHADPKEPVEIVAARVVAVGQGNRPELVPDLPEEPGRPLGESDVYSQQGRQCATLFARDVLAPRQRLHGPSIVLQEDATTLIALDWTAVVDSGGNLVMTHTKA